MAAQWPVADLCKEVLAALDATEQSLGPTIAANAYPRSFRTLVLDLVQPLRTSVSRLERDADPKPTKASPGLPPSIERAAISILDSCERTLAAIRNETVEDTLNSTNISPSSKESAALDQLRSFNDRLNIVLDLMSLSSTNLLGADAGVGLQAGSVSAAASKADILVTIAQMRGLFVSKKSAPEGPPTYDEAVQGQPRLVAEEKSQSSGSSCNFETAKNNKVDSTPVSNARLPPRNESGQSTHNWQQSGEFKATKLATIQKNSKLCSEPGGVLSIRCVGGKDGGRLVLTTLETLELYNTASDTPLWILEGSSRQFLQWYGDPVKFTGGLLQLSPDGKILCAEIARRSTNRELLILDPQDGRVITRRNLLDKDGSMSQISPDNTKVALLNWAYSHERLNQIRIIPIDVASNDAINFGGSNPGSSGHGFNAIPIPQLRRGCGITMSFAPDSKHIITCEGKQVNPGTDTGDKSSSICIRVYRCTLTGGTLVDEVFVPASLPPANPLFETWMSLPMRFHYLGSERWLVSFADFVDNVSKTRIVEATTGETVALVSAERSRWQSWKSGVLQPDRAEITFDEASGRWTRMELTKTLLPPGKTITITRFELPGSSWRQGNLESVKDAWSVARCQVMVLNVGPDDLCDLSREGTLLIVRRAATHQVDVWSIGG